MNTIFKTKSCNLGQFDSIPALTRWFGPSAAAAIRMDPIAVENYQTARMRTDLDAFLIRRYPHLRMIVAARVFTPWSAEVQRRAGREWARM